MTETGLFRNLVIWSLEIIWNLGFEYCDFPAKAGFSSTSAELGFHQNRPTRTDRRTLRISPTEVAMKGRRFKGGEPIKRTSLHSLFWPNKSCFLQGFVAPFLFKALHLFTLAADLGRV
jgi:hypothetical protein